ncbi:MAG: D-alanine--D-alanine ligase [Bacteroidota bacterium]
MRVGIFFGGQSREREISFAGGRTVYDNLNKSLFEPVPIFVDSIGNFILLDWEFVYKGTIRDFYPPALAYPASSENFQLYIESITDPALQKQSIEAVGRKIQPEEFANLFDFAFLALHGPYGEDGNLQGLMEWYHIPYSGSGILPSAIGINKVVQKTLMSNAGFNVPSFEIIKKSAWEKAPKNVIRWIANMLDFPMVIKAPNQGSSIGISIVKDVGEIAAALNKSFFIEEVDIKSWKQKTHEEKVQWINELIDIRVGTGLPVYTDSDQLINHPDELMQFLNNSEKKTVKLVPLNAEEEVLVEAFIAGREFSCIVIQDETGNPIALPPTEIKKADTFFDYRAKYLPGISRKVTPIDLPHDAIASIREECEMLFDALQCQVYARIDGFITEDDEIFLNDPNTTSGMLPSSFFFHQAAEINLTPSDFLTYLIKTSLEQRLRTGKRNVAISRQLTDLKTAISSSLDKSEEQKRVAVIMGGFSSERHISVESGRNIFEKLNSTPGYSPIPVFLTGDEHNHELYVLPINVMLKDNADDIKAKIMERKGVHPVITQIREETADIVQEYTNALGATVEPIDYQALSKKVDFAFIALHGRPGEDGAIQQHLEKHQIPYNGSGVASSQRTINKAETNQYLRANGVLVASHFLVHEADYKENEALTFARLEESLHYPVIAKPADDGCSSAVKKINNREELAAFAKMIFRTTDDHRDPQSVKMLGLKPKEEFPIKTYFMVEELISRKDADHFLEITGGMLTRYDDAGNILYEVFEPSEALATGEVLSLEEKFLAGEGQNITPARFSKDQQRNQQVSDKVRLELEKVARLLNVEGYCRIDAFVRIYPDKVETIIIEVNSLPGMTPATCIFHQSAIADMKPFEFINGIIQFGYDKQKNSLQTY